MLFESHLRLKFCRLGLVFTSKSQEQFRLEKKNLETRNVKNSSALRKKGNLNKHGTLEELNEEKIC